MGADANSSGALSARSHTPWRHKLVQWDVTHFAIPLSFSAFAAMWKAASAHYVRVPIPDAIYIVLWSLALFMLLVTLSLYLARLALWRSAVLWDFNNPRLVNFFFMPVIIGSLLLIGAPDALMRRDARRGAFVALTAYQVLLSVYLYGEWLFGSVLIASCTPWCSCGS